MKKYVYLFSEGNANMRELLGGKGANLAEMTNIGLPVPQGFTITTEACTRYYEDGREIAPEIGQLAEVGMKMQTRGPLPLPERPYDYRHTPAELLSALAQILLRGTGESAPEENETLRRAAPKPIIFSVREKSEQLLGLLRKNGHMSLGSMFGICKSRSELVATFLSVLELCSDGHIRVSGEEGNYDVSRALTDTEE